VTSTRKSKYFWLTLYFLYFIYILLISFYAHGTGDEGVYHYQARLVAEGYLPVRDFFASNPIGFYGTYALFIKFLSCNLESARLFSVLALLSIGIMLSVYLRREFGNSYALVGFVFYVFNAIWLNNNIQVSHSTPANLGLFVSFFLLTSPKSLSSLHIFSSGIFFGLMANSRIPLIPTVFVLLWILIMRCKSNENALGKSKYLKRSIFNTKRALAIGLFTTGIVLATVPSLYLFLNNSDAFIFDNLGFRLDIKPGDWPGSSLDYALAHPIRSRLETYWYFLDPRRQNWILIWPLLIWVMWKVKNIGKRPNSVRKHTSFLNSLYAGAILLVIILSYSILSDAVFPIYLNHIVPYTIILFCYVLYQVFDKGENKAYVKLGSYKLSLKKFKYIIVGFLLLAMIQYCYPQFLSGAKCIVAREKHSHANPVTNARLASWIERNTKKDETILSWRASPVSVAGRRLPTGMEQGYGVAEIFWHRLSNDRAERYNIITREKIRKQLTEGKIHMVIDDPYSGNAVLWGFDDYHSLLKSQYTLVGTYAHYKIYVTPLWEASCPLSPLPSGRHADFWRDLINSLKRLVGADFTS